VAALPMATAKRRCEASARRVSLRGQCDSPAAGEGGDPVTGHKAFWDDLTHDLRDPEFRREYAAQSKLIAEVDAAINADPPGARP